jgi:uncharacterized membrane protein
VPFCLGVGFRHQFFKSMKLKTDVNNSMKRHSSNKYSSSRPIIRPNLTTIDNAIEWIGWLTLLGIWILTLSSYSSLAETIPMHYNGFGEPDGFGDKSHIVTLPIVASALFLMLTFLNRFPQIFNYATEITQENALYQYRNACRMIRVLKLVIAIIFGLIVFQTIQCANGSSNGLGACFLPIIVGLIFLPMFYYLTKSSQNARA